MMAVRFAAERHANHRRKGAAQEPYVNHLIEVADLVARATDTDEDLVIAALCLRRDRRLHRAARTTPLG